MMTKKQTNHSYGVKQSCSMKFSNSLYIQHLKNFVSNQQTTFREFMQASEHLVKHRWFSEAFG